MMIVLLAELLLAVATPTSASRAWASPVPSLQPVDPAFGSGLAALRKTTGIIEVSPDGNRNEWMPHLDLLIGVKAVEGAKRSVFFVELTTINPPTDPAGQPSSSGWHTNRSNWARPNGSSSTNMTFESNWASPNGSSSTNMSFEFVYRFLPVAVRVFDETGRTIKQGQTVLPWELMTNSLADACRICLELRSIKAMPSTDARRDFAIKALLGGTNTNSITWEKLMRPIAAGFLSLGGLFGECVATPALSDICQKAHCAIRYPGFLTLISTGLGSNLDLNLVPQLLTDVSIVKPGVEGQNESWYRFPADLNSGKKTLVRVEFVVGPSNGAEVMLGGIRSIRAVHPSKPHHEFLAQVLAVGMTHRDPTGEEKAAGK